MEEKKGRHLDDIFKLIKNFAQNSLALKLTFNGSEDELDTISSELNILDKKISIAKRSVSKQWGDHDLQTDFVLKLIDSAPDGIIAVNEKGKIVLFNKQAERLFGYNREEMIGGLLEVLLPKRFLPVHEALVLGYFNNPTTRPMGSSEQELTGRRKNGEEFPVAISLSYIETIRGKVAISAIRDITEQKRLYEELSKRELELQKSNTVKDQLFSIIGHDLIGSIGSMPMAIGLCKDEKMSSEERNTVLSLMEENAIASFETLQTYMKNFTHSINENGGMA